MRSKLGHFLRQGPVAMILAGLFFAGMAAAVKEVSADIPLFQVTFFRAAVSALIIGAAMRFRNIEVRGRNRKLLLIRSLVGFIAMSLNFFALSRIGLGDASILNQSSPVFVMLLSWILLEERANGKLIALTLLGFAGIFLILRPSGHIDLVAGGAGVLGAVFAALAYVSIRHLHQTDSFWTMSFYFMAVAAALSLVPMLATWRTPDAAQFLLLVVSGIFGTMGQLLMTYAYKHEEASWVAPFTYSGVLFSFLLGIFLFGERLDWGSALGSLIIMGSSIALIRLKRSIRVPVSAVIPPTPEESRAGG